MTNLFGLSGRVAMVTGANTGIGQGIAAALRALVPPSPPSAVRRWRKRARWCGTQARASIPFRRTCPPPHPSQASSTRQSTFGAIDILVNNAGIVRRANSVDFTEEDWDAVIDVNLKTPFFLTQAAGRQRHGHEDWSSDPA